ncbi:MAG: cupin domain-containing protein, partial [Arenibacterium sp.]
MPNYYSPQGGLPPQEELLTGRAVFTEAYAVIPKGTMRDITTSLLPHWTATRLWVIARPLSGFAETFSHYLMEVASGGGSTSPESDSRAEAVLFITDGAAQLSVGGTAHTLETGGYAYLPAGADWELFNPGSEPVRFHWIRKAYVAAENIPAPEAFVTDVSKAETIEMPGTDGRWS